jgi:hypothetical protein
MLQVARVRETLWVHEHIDLFSSHYRRSLTFARACVAESAEARKIAPLCLDLLGLNLA